MKAASAVCLVALALVGVFALQAAAGKDYVINGRHFGSKSDYWTGPAPWEHDKPGKTWYGGKWENKPAPGPKTWGGWSKGLSSTCAQGYYKHGTAWSYIDNNDQLSTLSTVLTGLSSFSDIPNYKAALDSKSWKNTLLAPINDAFTSFIGTLQIDITSPAVFAQARYFLSDLINYHIVLGRRDTKFLRSGAAYETAHADHFVYWQTKDGSEPVTTNGLSWGIKPKGPQRFVDEQNRALPIVCADVKAGWGLVDVISQVALASNLAPSLTAAAQSAGLTTLISLVSAYPDLVEFLENSPIILFAPTNAAFAAAGPVPPEALEDVLLNHVVPFSNTTTIYETKPSNLVSGIGQPLVLKPDGVKPTSVIYNGNQVANIVGRVWTPLGRVLVVDKVLVPAIEPQKSSGK